MIGLCRLYEIESELRNSHICPKFVIDYFKKTGSKYLRPLNTPNQRLQDGTRRPYLSEKAEQLFSKSEKWFSEKVFIEYLENKKLVFDYDEHLFYFAISYLWRILLLELDTPIIQNQTYYNRLKEVEKEWRFFLKDYKYPNNFNTINLLLTDRVKSHNLDAQGVDYYFTRIIDSTIVANDNGSQLVIYGKFLRFIFWAVIDENGPIENRELKINPYKGQIRFPQEFRDENMGGFFVNRIKQIDALPKPSINQQEKISQEIDKDFKKVISSDAGESLLNDYYNLNSNRKNQ